MLQLGMINLIYLMDLILFQIFKTILHASSKNMKQIYVNEIKGRIVFKIKAGYKLELLSKETMRLLESSKEDIDQDKDGDILPKLEIVDVVLMNCNLLNNTYQQASKLLFTFVPNKQIGQLITVEPQPLTILERTSAEFSFIEIWFTDQNNRPL